MSEEDNSGCSVGCMGCLIEILGLLGLLYLWFHRAEIWGLIIK